MLEPCTILLGLSTLALVAAGRLRVEAHRSLDEAARLRGEATLIREELLSRLRHVEALGDHLAVEVGELIDDAAGIDLTALGPPTGSRPGPAPSAN